MKIFITGCEGQVGYELVQLLSAHHEVLAMNRSTLDLTQTAQVQQTLERFKPQLIINPAAYTAVDQAEDDVELCEAVNTQVPMTLGEYATAQGIGLIHYSTDYVYDGTKPEAYLETDTPNPRSVYGRTKLQGDQALLEMNAPCCIFRTSWVYGPRGKNFFLTMKKLLVERDQLTVVNDQFGAPTSARVIAAATVSVIKQLETHANSLAYWQSIKGVYHLTCHGRISWYDFASAIAEKLKSDGHSVASLSPISSQDYPCKAQRPANSVLDCHKFESTFHDKLPLWEQAFDAVWQASQTRQATS